jgi:magnesium chelatase subunit H
VHKFFLFLILIIYARVFGAEPTDDGLNSYLEAYFGERLDKDQRELVIANLRQSREKKEKATWFDNIVTLMEDFFRGSDSPNTESAKVNVHQEANSIASLLSQSTEELTSLLEGLDGGYIKPAPGGGKNNFRPFPLFWRTFLIYSPFFD